MTASLICQQCGSETTLGGKTTICPECGTEYGTEGLGTGTAPAEDRPSEKKVQTRIKAALRQLGCHVSDLSQPRAAIQTPGLPDLYVMHPRLAVALWVEVKRPGGTVSRAQMAWHALAERCGVEVVVADGPGAVVERMEGMADGLEVGA